MNTIDYLCNCEGCELRNIFFEDVSTDEIEFICHRKIQKEFKKGEIIIREGEEIKDFIYLKQGLVKLFRNGMNNKEQIISIAKPFDFVSLLSTFSDTHYSYSVASIEEAVTCHIDLQQIKNIALHNGKFAFNIIEKLSKSSDKIINTLMDIRQKHLYGRVAQVLIFFAQEVYNSPAFELPISRKEMADYIGMTTENVVRTLTELRKDKLIKAFGKSIEITDMVHLIKIAKLG